jgi:hypothetical protein
MFKYLFNFTIPNYNKGEKMDIVSILVQILLGMFYGAQASLYGYMSSDDLAKSWTVILTKKFWESFDPVKALKTVILGALMGGLQVFTILNIVPMDVVEKALLVNFVSSIFVLGTQKFINLVVRRTPLVKIWNLLKEKMGLLPLQQ